MNTRFRVLAFAVFVLVIFSVLGYRADGFPLSASLVMAQGSDPASPLPLVLTDNQSEYSLGLHMEILEDPEGNLTIDQVSSPEFDAQFLPSQEESPNYGFTKNVYWVRLSLDNETLQTIEWLLEVNFASTHYVDLYTPRTEGEGFEVRQTGLFRPVSTRDIFHPQVVFDLFIPTQSQQTIYMRFQSGSSMNLGLTLWTNDAFLVNAQWQNLLNGLFYGILIAVLIYNLFLFISIREVDYFYLVFELALTILYVSSYDGYMEVYIVPNLYHLAPYYFPLFYILLFFSIVLFADSFLKVKAQFPVLHWINLGILGTWGVLVLLIPFASYYFLSSVAPVWSIISMIAILIAGIVTFRKGLLPILLFFIAWAGLLISLIIIILTRIGIAPLPIVSDNLFRLGFVWMGVCWSIALADRINLLKAETESANRSLQKSESKLLQILEGMPLGVVLYGKDQKPEYINQRSIDILSNPAKGIRPDVSANRTLAQVLNYFSLKIANTEEEYPLENFPPFKALQGVASSIDDIEADQGDKRIPVEIWASPVKDETGNVEYAVVAFQDITRRKQAEAELVEYRRHLEALVENRTTEINSTNAALDTANKELRLRLEWMSALVSITEIMAQSFELTQIYEKVIEIINRLFAVQDSFIAEFEADGKKLKILAHSCSSDDHPDLIGSYTVLPAEALLDVNPEQGKHVFVSGNALYSLDGPLGTHIRATGIQGIALVPLQLREQIFGFLGLELNEVGRIILSEEANLLSIFSLDIAQLIKDSRLFEQAKMLIAVEERNRLARELHDSVTQTLFTASVLAEVTPRIWNKDQAIARQNMEKLNRLIRGALAEMRSMLLELRSGDLNSQTLDQLLVTLVEAARGRSSAHITAAIENAPELPQNVTLACYRIAREALNNTLVHSSASAIHVSMLASPGGVEIRIKDDGCGFDPHSIPTGHMGISIMEERAQEAGASLRVESKPGLGTEVIVVWTENTEGVSENSGS